MWGEVKTLTCVVNTVLYGGLMVKHVSTGPDVKSKDESEAVGLKASTYILRLDGRPFQIN